MKPRNNVINSESNEKPTYPGFGVLGRYPVISLLCFACLGVATGLGLMQWSPLSENEEEKKENVILWIGLIGDLFIRALKCVVLPLVFLSVIISIVDMMKLQKASKIAWKTIGLYVFTTVIASIIGIFSILMYQGLFHQAMFAPPIPAMITLGCNAEGSLLTEQSDGSVICTTNYNDKNSQFSIQDITKTFETTASGPKALTLSDTIYQGIFHKLVPSNLIASFTSGNFAAVIFFALAFGFALGHRIRKNKKEGSLMAVIVETNDVFLTFINWIIMCTPFAVFSLIASTLGKQENAKEHFKNVGYLVSAIITGQLIHVIIVWFVIFPLWTKWNPFSYLKNIIPAQTMAFACSSSAATIPVTLQSLRNTGKVPEAIVRFVVPLGATINMDGTALGYPITCVWLAILNGIKPDFASYILLIIIATIGSIGSAPIPSAGLVLIITAYNSVFNTTGIPEGFGYVVAIDWLMDRLETVMNVTGDTIVAGIVAKTTPLEEEELKEIDKMNQELEQQQTIKQEADSLYESDSIDETQQKLSV